MNKISNNIEKNPRPNLVGSPNIEPQSSENKQQDTGHYENQHLKHDANNAHLAVINTFRVQLVWESQGSFSLELGKF